VNYFYRLIDKSAFIGQKNSPLFVKIAVVMNKRKYKGKRYDFCFKIANKKYKSGNIS
jgi:hypothetical protein